MATSPFDQLDNEWRRARHDEAARTAYASLRDRIPSLANISDADTLIRLARRGHGVERIDRILAELTQAAAHDQQAARITLQVLIPGLKLVAVRLSWAADPDTVESTVITTAWDRICHYPIRRRPRRVAANIIRDTQSRVRRELQHPREVATDADELNRATSDIDYLAIEAADHIRRSVRRGRITPRAAQIIVSTRIHHQTFEDLVDATGDTEEVLRRHRERAEARLRRGAA